MSIARMTAWLLFPCALAGAETLKVGPGHPFDDIAAAYGKAQPGDVIEIHPREDGAAYARLALAVEKARITFRGVGKGDARIRIDGTGFDYNGSGPTPRGIFEFRKGGDGCVVENLELCNARNNSANGAGVRINTANDITIRNCEIRHCDNGIMSNGDLRDGTGARQQILDCHIHHNGSSNDAGGTHNLYLDGTSVLVQGCSIHDSTVGHNFKSRAHYTRLAFSHLQDAAEREVDIVDHKVNTAAPNSDAVVLGCVIAKKRDTEGNRGTFFMGSDGGAPRDGTLFVVHCTISTPYSMGLVVVTHSASKVRFHDNIVWSDGVDHRSRAIVEVFRSGNPNNVAGSRNWFCSGYTPGRGNALSREENVVGARGDVPPFVDVVRRDFRLTDSNPEWLAGATPLTELRLPGMPGEEPVSVLGQFRAPLGWERRDDRLLGALPVR